MKKIFYPLFILSFLQGIAQEKIKFNEFDRSYFEMTNCPFDSSAGAFYILDYGKTDFNREFEPSFTHHVILKVLSSEEYDRADIRIPFKRGDRIENFEAATYNMVDGEVVEDKLKRRDAIIENLDDESNSFNFTFPNVREGSIIEYTYELSQGSIQSLNTWYFQTSIPVVKSQYEVIIPTYFQYERIFQGYFPLDKADLSFRPITIGGISTDHQIHNYVATNIPAFKKEPFITTTSDYIGKIIFELKKYKFPNELEKVFIPESFFDISRQLYESDDWHKKITNSRFTREIVEDLQKQNEEKSELASAIYNYVRDNFTEDYEIDLPSLRRVFEEKKGTASQINRVLAAMMHEAGFDAHLALISTRKHGVIRKQLPMAKQLNFTLAHIRLNDEDILLDASEKNIPFGVLPPYCINGDALLISDQPAWIPMAPYKNNSITYGGNFIISSGYLTGELTRKRTGYRAWSFLDGNDDMEDYKENFSSKMGNWIIESHEVGKLEDDSKLTEKMEIEIDGKIDDLGEVIYLNPILYNQMLKSPLKSETRQYPLNYGYPSDETHFYQINIGEEYTVDELPDPLALALPNDGGFFRYQTSLSGNVITILCKISFNRLEYPAEEYPYLREFYAQLIEKQGEQIVLKRK